MEENRDRKGIRQKMNSKMVAVDPSLSVITLNGINCNQKVETGRMDF